MYKEAMCDHVVWNSFERRRLVRVRG